jgi:hypothetical protein
MWRRVFLALVGVMSVTACAAATSSTRSPFIAGARRDVITAAEIVASRVTDVYQAVSQLRPEFLKRRPSMLVAFTPAVALVYLDDLPFGGPESLRHIPLERVRLIRYMQPAEADLRWGGTHPVGAILVTTLK